MLEKYNWINKKGLVRSVMGPTLNIVPGSPLTGIKLELRDREINIGVYKKRTTQILYP